MSACTRTVRIIDIFFVLRCFTFWKYADQMKTIFCVILCFVLFYVLCYFMFCVILCFVLFYVLCYFMFCVFLCSLLFSPSCLYCIDFYVSFGDDYTFCAAHV